MKRLIALLLSLLFVFAVVGCKKKPDEVSTPETTSSPDTESDNSSSNNESTVSKDTNSEPSNPDNNTASNSNTNSINNSSHSQNNSASVNTSSQNSVNNNTNSDNESTSSDNTNTEPSNTNGNSSSDNTSSDNKSTSSDNESSDVSSETTADNENEYKNISCRNVGNDEWKTADISVNGNNQFYINLSIPSDWEIVNGVIKRNGLQIGVISEKLADTSVATYEKIEKNDSNEPSVLIRSSVEKYETNGTPQYKRLFKVTQYLVEYGKNICIFVNYAELDNASANKLYNSIITVNYTNAE